MQWFYFSVINSPFHMTPVSGFARRYPTKQPANVPLAQATPGTSASSFGQGTQGTEACLLLQDASSLPVPLLLGPLPAVQALAGRASLQHDEARTAPTSAAPETLNVAHQEPHCSW